MDLYAYNKIEDLKFILNEYKIDVPRLRGIRLMSNESKVSEESIIKTINYINMFDVEQWLKQHNWYCWSTLKGKKKCPALIYNKDKELIGYDMKKIHGKDKKVIKLKLKHNEKIIREQYNMFNRYVGKDVLYVHARIGGGNREFFHTDDLKKHPRYLEDCDDGYDSSYCDIYFDIKK